MIGLIGELISRIGPVLSLPLLLLVLILRLDACRPVVHTTWTPGIVLTIVGRRRFVVSWLPVPFG